jgi:hydrogenase expression/formation protein HypE
MKPTGDITKLQCPIPLGDHSSVQLAHGGGGRLMRQLIEGLLLPKFQQQADQEKLTPPHDSAVLDLAGTRVAFTTDSFVVNPLFFPGGDIGKLAVYGTVNDLAMAGARPGFLSCGLILEEGTPLATVERVIDSMQQAGEDAGISIVTGDTKVVDRGKADGVFINTSGIGVVPADIEIHPLRVQVGDRVLVSGDLGRHGIAIMSERENLRFDGAPESDCANLAGLVAQLTELGPDLHCLRDLTRGGLAAALIEVADHARVGIQVDEPAVRVTPSVAGACELLGLDPLYVANEGRFVAFVAESAAERALQIMKEHPVASDPTVIGTVTGARGGTVELKNAFGSGRLLDLFSGEQMPRIC